MANHTGNLPKTVYCNQTGQVHDWNDVRQHNGGETIRVCSKCGMAVSYGRRPVWDTGDFGDFGLRDDIGVFERNRRARMEEQRRLDAEKAAAARLTEAAATIARTTGVSMTEAVRALETLGTTVRNIKPANEPKPTDTPKPRRVTLPDE